MRAKILLWSLVALLLLCLPVSAIKQADPNQKVHDFANLLTDAEKAALNERALAIGADWGVDLAVVTVTSFDGLSSQAFADDFYDYNGFGLGTGDDGVMIVVNIATRDVNITSHGLGFRYVDDRTIDRILDNVTHLLSQGRYFDAFDRFLSDAGNYISKGVADSVFGVKDVLLALFIGVVVAGIAVGVMALLHKRSLRPAPGAGLYLDDRGMVLTRQVDQFMHTHTSRVPIPKNTSGGGGGGHTSSSGRTHGGGGRKF